MYKCEIKVDKRQFYSDENVKIRSFFNFLCIFFCSVLFPMRSLRFSMLSTTENILQNFFVYISFVDTVETEREENCCNFFSPQ